MDITTTANPVNPERAMAYFRKKVPLTDAQWNSIESANNDWAFRVAGIADLDLIDHVQSALQSAIDTGTQFEAFKAAVGESLEKAWGGTVKEPGWRLETIFRTNLLSSYNAGHYEQAQEQIDDRPYAIFDYVEDDALCEDCSAVSELIGHEAIPLDEWGGEIPPLHHCCRCGFITLSREEAEAMGILEKMPDVSSHIADGFNEDPGDEQLPDPDEYTDVVREYLGRFLD
jgi:Phage Mu protein F like protein.